MTRVGFIMLSAGSDWLGGASYYRNLLFALRDSNERAVEPVILTSADAVDPLRAQFPGVAVVAMPTAGENGLAGRARRALQLALGRDLLREKALARHRIDVLSHSGYLGRRSPIPSIVWIPDFQERAFPEFFSTRDLSARARNLRNSCRHATTILLSSQAARYDLEAIAGDCAARTEVLSFVADVPAPDELPSRAELEKTYALPPRFFHLPNQFWIYKNHQVVLKALALLRQRGQSVPVLATGNTADHRQPGHFRALMEMARDLDLRDAFRPLGMVPFRDLMGLMQHSVAVINPSKFEGWSTTVEEAKSMGKAVVLSDIAVHREQTPERAAFFGPDDAEQLADALHRIQGSWNAAEDRVFVDRAAALLPLRRQGFAQRYQAIVEATLSHRGRTREKPVAASRTAAG